MGLASHDPYGAIENAELSVRGFCVEFEIWKAPHWNGVSSIREPNNDSGFVAELTGPSFHADVASDFEVNGLYPSGTRVIWIAVSSWSGSESRYVFGLLLKEDESSGRFRRVGVFFENVKSLSKVSWIERDLILI